MALVDAVGPALDLRHDPGSEEDPEAGDEVVERRRPEADVTDPSIAAVFGIGGCIPV